MKLIAKSTYAFLVLGLVFFSQSCKKDPRFDVSGNINSAKYTAGGSLSLLYSTDGGATFSSNAPTGVEEGDVIKVKVSNGTMNLGANDFTFNWSASSPKPSNTTADVVEFTVNDANPTVSVTITDKTELIAVNATSGKFYSFDKNTGAATEAFTVSLNNAPLTTIRSFAYNYTSKLYYAGLSNKGGGKLVSINPGTKQATVINQNADNLWDGIASLIVTPDNKLLTTMFVDGQSLTTFSVTGTASTPIELTGNPDICCGMGMTFNSATELLIGDYNYYNGSNKAKLYKASLNGAITETIELDFVNFGTLTDASVYIRSLLKDEAGTIYGLVYADFEGSNTTDATHLVKIDLTAKKMTSIAIVGANSSNQYLGFALIPSYLY